MMKTPAVLVVAALFIAVGDGFTPFLLKNAPFKNGFLLPFAVKKGGDEAKPFFAESTNEANDDAGEAEQAESKETTVIEAKAPPPPVKPPEPVISNEVKEEMTKAANAVGHVVMDQVVSPLLSKDIEKGVSKGTIRGAALAGATLSLLAGQGLLWTGAAGLGAAYVAISPGKPGSVLRAIGSAAWESAQAAVELSEKYGTSQKLGTMTQSLVSSTMQAIQGGTNVTSQAIAEQMDIEEEFEKARQEAIQKKQKAKEKDLAEKKKEREEMARLEEEARLAEEEALKLEQEEARLEQEARLAAKKVAEEERKAEEARKAEEERQAEAEKARLAEELRQEEEARLAEEAKKREEARLAEEARLEGDLAMEDKDLEASVRLAQNLDGDIAGLEQAIADSDEKAEWEAASRLAQELGKPPIDEEDFEEQDMEALAKAARDAVEKFEAEMQMQDASMKERKEKWDSEMIKGDKPIYEEEEEELEEYEDKVDADFGDEEWTTDDEEYEDQEVEDFLEAMGNEGVDLEELGRAARAAVEEFETEGEMEDLGKAARAAVEMFESDASETETVGTVQTDWSKFTVAQLRDELRSRGLKTTGKKAVLVATLTESDLELASANEEMAWETDIEEPSVEDMEAMASEEPDIEELGRAARAAVEMFEQQEADTDDEGEASAEVEFESMTVKELKDELRNRGLKLSGKKAELIERLRSS